MSPAQFIARGLVLGGLIVFAARILIGSAEGSNPAASAWVSNAGARSAHMKSCDGFKESNC